MGNSPSSSSKQPAGQSPGRTHSNHDRHTDGSQRTHDIPARREPRRRESINTLSSAKATAAPPSASLESATAQPISASGSPQQTRNTSSPSHTRTRSSTVATPRLQPTDAQYIDKAMGNESSRLQQVPPRSRARDTPPPTQSEPKASPASRPVDVPGGTQSFLPSPLDPSAPPSEAYQLPPASYSRPPRLPLAIEEEIHTPGSPIISPLDAGGDNNDVDNIVTRRASVISSTVDDEDEPDEYQGHMPATGVDVPKIPTIVEWRDAAPTDKVYVTGTFTDWQRKYRLHHK